ncbi:MAG: M48 family metallopeptidase [Candidatus Berkiella sp.]
MNFFEQQDKARKKTTTLVLYFILAILLIIIFVDLLIVGTMIYASYPDSSHTIHFTINDEQTTLINNGKIDFRVFIMMALMTSIVVAPVILLVIGLGTVIRLFQTRGGGLSIAEMVKARPLDQNTQDFKEKRFINIVEEMSIASGVPVPQLFVMDNETSINAFVAGYHPSDIVMVVTQGALDTLDRDALQGVIGHEYSHIFNGDMRINLRLIGLLGGIFAIGQLGAFILRSLSYRSSSSSSSSDKKGGGIFIVIIIGVGLFVIGYIGLFFGRLIKAAISRQRESLADASSVQYTRNPQGLINALTAIQENQKGSQLKSSHAEDINHMCFGPSLNMWFSSLLASHPPIYERIQALNPEGYFSTSNKPKKIVESIKQQPSHEAGAFVAGMTSLNAIEQSIGHLSQHHIDYTKQMLDAIPEDIKSKTHDPAQAELILYAILMPTHDSLLNEQAEAILKDQIDPNTLSTIRQFGQQIDEKGSASFLPIIDLTIPSLRQKSPDEKARIIRILDQLVTVNPTLFTFSAAAVIKKSIQPASAKRIQYLKVAALLPQISQLLAFIICCGNNDAKTSSVIYQQVMQQFTDKAPVMPSATGFNINEFQQILSKLNMLTPLAKEKLVHACLICIEVDQQIAIKEAEAIRAIAACLNCPIPPILPTLKAV